MESRIYKEKRWERIGKKFQGVSDGTGVFRASWSLMDWVILMIQEKMREVMGYITTDTQSVLSTKGFVCCVTAMFSTSL